MREKLDDKIKALDSTRVFKKITTQIRFKLVYQMECKFYYPYRYGINKC